jgi:ABC-type Fe3+ transport system substrate-binding protein
MNRRISAVALLCCFWLWPAHTSAAQGEWDRVVAEAKKEGRLHLIGFTGSDARKALTETFSQRYGITVEYYGTSGPDLPPRIMSERRAGVHFWDVIIAGSTTLLKGLKPAGILQPLDSALILPEVKDPKYWRGDPFLDDDHTVLAITRRAGQYLYVNTDLVKSAEIDSWRYLLKPEFKGKILIGRDPQLAGYGKATFAFFYRRKDLGPEFIRQLAKQDVRIMEDDRTAAIWLAQGRYPICICSHTQTGRLMKEGLPLKPIDARQLKEGTFVSSSFANASLPTRPRHPNAAKLYLNWVLGKEGGEIFSRATGNPTMRLDVPTDFIEPWVIPMPAWPAGDTEDALKAEEPTTLLIKEVFGGR